MIFVVSSPQRANALRLALQSLHVNCRALAGADELQCALRTSGSAVAAVILDPDGAIIDLNHAESLIRQFAPRATIETASLTSDGPNGSTELSSAAARQIAQRVLLRMEGLQSSEARGKVLSMPANEAWEYNQRSLFDRLAQSTVPVLITGETGVGKEYVAKQIHERSPRRTQPFIKVNCAALPNDLLESELFGFEKGAFTGATRRNAGRFELADNGTILLDEIGDMSTALQAKMLHVLQDSRFTRLGGQEVISADVRVIAATNRDLGEAVEQGRFREDLLYRLNVVTINVPPLRERVNEILPLARTLLKKHCAEGVDPPELPDSLAGAMMSYHWPGNIRELENYVRRLLVLQNPEEIAAELRRGSSRHRTGERTPAADKPASPAARPLYPPASPDPGSAAEQNAPAPDTQFEERRGNLSGSSALAQVHANYVRAELQTIVEALNATMWNRKAAARLLGMEYKALLYKMRRLGVKAESA